MLLYSLLHLTGLRRHARRPQVVPPVGQPDARPPRVRPDARRRGDDRSARPGHRERGRHGDRRAPARGRVQPRRPSDRRPLDLRDRVRRRPPGGHRVRGVQPRRPPAARQARRPVRRQPHPARRADRDGLVARTSSRASTPTAGTRGGSRTATTSARSRPRSTAARADDRPSLIAVRTHIGFGSPNKQDSQKAHGAPLGPDEVRLTKEAYGWDPDRTFFVPDEALGAVPRGDPRRRAPRRRLGGRGSRRYAAAHPDARRRVPPADRAASWPPAGTRTSRRTRPGPRWRPGTPARTRSRPCAARVPELFGGAADLSESNLTDVKGEANFSADEAGPQPALRRPRARDGRHRQRHRVPRRLHPVRRHVPDVQRLHARRRPARRARRAARHRRLDARLRRARRGRPDAPAGRALRRAAGDPEPVVRPAGRRQRDGRGLGAGRRAARRAGGPRPDPPEAADAARHGRAGPRGRRARRLRPARGDAAATPALILIGTGSELQLAFAAAEALEADGIRDPRRLPALLGALRGPGRRPIATRSCRRRSASASASRSASRSAGSAGSATRARSSGSTTSARRRRPGRSSSTSGSPPSASPTSAGGSSATGLRGRVPTLDGGHFGARRGRGDGVDAATAIEPSRSSVDAHRVRRRSCRGRPQGRAARPARGGRARPRADRPRRRRLRSGGRLPGLRASGSGTPSATARPTAASSSAAGASARRVAANKIRGIRAGRLPRHVLRPPGRRARRHERA